MKFLSAAIIFFIFNTTYAQTFKLTVNDLPNGNAYIYSLQGEKTDLIDSVISFKDDNIIYHFQPNKFHTGFYRITLGQNRWIDFIYDSKNIEIKTNANDILDSIKVITSESNRLYYSFIRLNKLFKTKTELLQLVLARYPKETNYYETTKNELEQVQRAYSDFVNKTSRSTPDSFVAKYIKSSQLPLSE